MWKEDIGGEKQLIKNEVAVEKPQGLVLFFGELCPVTWERETKRYVYKVRRLEKGQKKWIANKKYFEEKMDKEEIYLFNGKTYR